MPEALNVELGGLYRRLLIADLQRRLPGESLEQVPGLSGAELSRLVSAASWLALAESAEDRTLAYEISTRAAALYGAEYPTLPLAADFILARLGNFPGRELLRQRHEELDQLSIGMGALLRLEAWSREAENTPRGLNGETRPLTNFQFELFSALNSDAAVSVSAPTSAGKSFVFALDVKRRLQAGTPASIVYLVPTRALIRQVTLMLRQELAKAGLRDTPVRSVPRPLAREEAPAGVVYVLTQERLLSLLGAEDAEPWISALIVDEAQGIGDGGGRGVLLHDAIEAAMARFPSLQIFFASPMTKNPDYLLRIFGRAQRGRAFTEECSPVSQNLILVSPAAGTDGIDMAAFSLLSGDERIELGKRRLGFTLRDPGVLDRRAALAKQITPADGCCLIYANGARDAEKLAGLLIEGEQAPTEIDAEITELIAFLTDHIHPQYGLIEVLRHRVAFHYGYMPGSVRAAVEDLAKAGKLRFICCTSTLLQGVNLPARDIVVENPQRGHGHAMARGDFLNLAGRAGRLLKEFHGNVWCLRPEKWQTRCFEGERLHEMVSAFDRALADGGLLIQRVLAGNPRPQDDAETGVAALGKVFADFVQTGRPLDSSRYRSDENVGALRTTLSQLTDLRTTLPPEIFARNLTVLPNRLEELYDEFSSADELRDYLPIAPNLPSTNIRLREIFKIVQTTLQGDTTDSYRYHAGIAARWVHHEPLQRIIQSRLDWLSENGREFSVRDVIYDVIETIETAVRFLYVKHLRAYNDVLAVALRARGLGELADSLVPMHLFLECGASHPIALALISLGLSRTAALLLRTKIAFPHQPTPEQWLVDLGTWDLGKLKLPPTVRREIEQLVHGT